jgi:hypothetical protein
MALEVALAIGPRRADAHDGQERSPLHYRPDIRLHPNSINATIVHRPADIREESIYFWLANHVRLCPSLTPRPNSELSNLRVKFVSLRAGST